MTDATDTTPLLNSLKAHEIRVWQALVEGDAQADANALSEDFLGVYPDGFSGKDAHVAQLAGGATVASFELTDCRVIPMGPSHALLAYCARYRRIGASQDEEMYVSSIWQRDGAGWINIFSQDTRADPDHDLP